MNSLTQRAKPIFFTAFFLTVSFFFSFYSANAQTIKGSISGNSAEKGKRQKGVITLSLPDGLHVNSFRPLSEYSIPTTVRLSATKGVKVYGPTYPRGKTKTFQFSKNPINVYEGVVNFPFTFIVPTNYTGKTVTVRAVVRYQACTDSICYPPKTQTVLITARVK